VNVRRLLGWANLLVSAVLMLVIWLLIVWVSSRPALKRLIDWTPQQVNTVDPETEHLVADLVAQRVRVDLHTFFLPYEGEPPDDFQRHRLEIISRLRMLTSVLLRRYAWLGGEHVRVHEHDLSARGDNAKVFELRQRFGLQNQIEDTVVVAVAQSGRESRHRSLSLEQDLATIETPATRVSRSPTPQVQVPVLKDFRGEEAVSSAIKSLLVTGIPIAYLAGGLGPPLDRTTTIGAGYGRLLERLQGFGFDLRHLDELGRGVPADCALLLVLEPAWEFTEPQANAMFAYLRRGGRMLLNYCYNGQPDWNPTGEHVGQRLGFEVGKAPVFHRIRGGYDNHPAVEKLDLAMNQNHPVTAQILANGLPVQVASARALLLRAPPQGVRVEELLATGPDGWLARPGPDGRPSLVAPRQRGERFVVGAVFEVDAEPSSQQQVATAVPQPIGQCVVVTGLFCNNLGMATPNAVLAQNLCNWLTERRVLLNIGARNYVARQLAIPVDRLPAIWRLVVLWVPGVFLVLGLLVYFWRRRL
jgi:hypothetical protein